MINLRYFKEFFFFINLVIIRYFSILCFFVYVDVIILFKDFGGKKKGKYNIFLFLNFKLFIEIVVYIMC